MRASSARMVRTYLHRGVISRPSSFSTVWCQANSLATRRDVVHPVDDGDVLVVVEVLAELLETGVQKADVRHGLDDRFAVECEDEPQVWCAWRGAGGRSSGCRGTPGRRRLRRSGRAIQAASQASFQVPGSKFQAFNMELGTWNSSLRSGQLREVMPLTVAAKRVVLPQGIRR